MTSGDPLCPCASGLRATRCCEFDPRTWGPRLGAQHLDALIRRAADAADRGETEIAGELCRDLLDLAPCHEPALGLLYRLCNAQGRAAASEALLCRLVAINPNNVAATQALCLHLFHKGALAEAELHARNAVRLAPENAQSHNLLAMVLTEANRPQPGEYHYRRAMDLMERPDAILLANLAWNLKNQGRMAEARDFYKQSVALKPDELKTLLGWARLEEADRDFPAASRLLDSAEAISPGDPGVRLTRAVVASREGRSAEALAALDALARDSGDAGLGPTELSEKGRLLDRMGQHGEAFAAFAAGKARARELGAPTYLAESAAELADRLRGFFTAGRLATLPRAGRRDEVARPIFILGFPRSGTTLVEQTLSAHPRIVAGDELPYIHDITGALPRMLASPLAYPEALAELWMGDQREALDTLRDHYLQRVRQSGILTSGAAWFTDKMPLNETHLGLIALLFPDAPLIDVIRHPLDVVLSVFSNHLTHGFYCAAELESAARHFVLIADLVQSYRAEMELRYLPLRYEDLVADQETSVRRMLTFIGATFDAGCLDFHKNRRYARTASYAQVTEPLYLRSRYRYRAYLRELAPVIPILAPVIARLGYAIEPPSG